MAREHYNLVNAFGETYKNPHSLPSFALLLRVSLSAHNSREPWKTCQFPQVSRKHPSC